MSAPRNPAKRPRRLFPRRIDEVVKQATQPLMDKQGKLYGALLRDWEQIVGHARAACTRPKRLQWPGQQASGAVLHVEAMAAMAPELAYATEQMLEQCARYFGYRAITRIVIHPSHEAFPHARPAPEPPIGAQQQPTEAPRDMMEILHRLRQRIATDDKR